MMNLNFRSVRATSVRPLVAARPPVAFSGMHAGKLTVGIPQAPQKHGLFVSNGATVFAMRHGKKKVQLGLPADQRRALIRSLVTEVLRHGQITTTKVRAKAIRKHVDHMITLAKGGSLHQRRQALGFVFDKKVVKSLFDDAPKRYGERQGGYCRVIPEPRRRRGDNAELAIIELV